MNNLLKFTNELINGINNSTANGTIKTTIWKNDIQKQDIRIAESYQQFLNTQKWVNNLKRSKRNTNDNNILNEETAKTN